MVGHDILKKKINQIFTYKYNSNNIMNNYNYDDFNLDYGFFGLFIFIFDMFFYI